MMVVTLVYVTWTNWMLAVLLIQPTGPMQSQSKYSRKCTQGDNH